MPLHHAVLALLTDRPNHGYELRGRFQEAIGPQWGGLNIGHLYQILDRLVRDGFVTRSQVTQADRPDKTLYTITPAGQDELRSWATSAWVRTGGFRDELFLKLFGAASLGSAALAALVTAQRQAYLSELAGLTRLRRSHTGDPLVALLIDAAIAHTKADLELVDTAGRRLTPLAENGAAAGSAAGSAAVGASARTPPDGAEDEPAEVPGEVRGEVRGQEADAPSAVRKLRGRRA
ncbi:transcriptional regulator, PadR family [Streptomyces sp. DvalAA-14]|uniref:PadR family transcriptional regulator n=1 Tax=unclassified Streptomyces TaxID=2593676 RepID=UPI00081B495A|nr:MULTISPECIES: PadR family transcriptional regulator [unclassified Streptomyces]MYS18694.1 PadR family transcriptional regulator [Streptomyces sp. SID4948]SCD27758.1 transcriptional regulator, PadR family [Streptomyces sp. DvalAA-14]